MTVKLTLSLRVTQKHCKQVTEFTKYVVLTKPFFEEIHNQRGLIYYVQ